jgi:hypothetical protein
MILGKHVGLLAAVAGLLSSGSHFPVIGSSNDSFERRQEPENRGRRAEKDAIALAKAEAKRRRKAEKRAAHNAKVSEGEND